MGMGKKICGILNPMGKRRRRRRRICGLDWIFNPMGMGKKRCGIFNPMGRRRRSTGVIFNPMGRKRRRCGDGDGDGDGDDHLLLLPEDVLIQILLCLPVISLLRFKSVCKSWRELIDSSFFIDLHTSTTTTTTFNSSSSSSSKFGSTFILQTTGPSSSSSSSCDYYEDYIKLYMLSSDESGDHGDGEYDNNNNNNDEDDDDDDQKKKNKVYDLGFSPFYKDFLLTESLRMVGSCNGIICLHDPKLMDDDQGGRKHHYSNLRDVSLWNPAIRQFRILPKSIPIKEKKDYMGCWLEDFIGFGYDIKTKDYKLLRISPWEVSEEEEEGGCMCRVQVYSLSTDSWRLLEGINSLPVVPNHGIYLNGSYFFVGNESDMILSFDFTKEIFTTMQLPKNDSRHDMVLSSLGEKLAFFTLRIDCDGYKYYDIWVLNEQYSSSSSSSGRGLDLINKESWTKLHSFRINRRSYFQPRCISNNGEFALISTGQGNTLFNLVTKEAKTNFTIGTTGVCRVEVYKESLVSIMVGGNVFLRWQLPTHGTTYKLNLNAPFIKSYFSFGIGLCLTSDTGGCIGVRSLQRRGVSDAAEGEALAMLEAIKWAKELELSPIIIESDSKKCVSFFMDDDDDDNNLTYWTSEALSLLSEAKLLLNSSELGTISFVYCSRSCNYVADIAAKLGRECLGFWTCKDWSTANFHGEMVRSLSKVLGSETR